MKQSGCWKVAIAPEVGDEESLRYLKKGFTLEQCRDVARWCKELDIAYYAFFLMGLPFQEVHHLQAISNLAIELDPLLLDISRYVAMPGTELYSETSVQQMGSQSSYYFEKTDREDEDRIYRATYFRFYLRFQKILQIIRGIGFLSFLKLSLYAVRLFFFSSKGREK